MVTVKTVYEIKLITLSGNTRKEDKETISVTGSGQKAAIAVDKKYKGRLFKKFFKGFQINDSFVPFHPPTIYS